MLLEYLQWHYRLWSYQDVGYKIGQIFALESTYHKEIIDFEFWINGELPKVGHHFNYKVI